MVARLLDRQKIAGQCEALGSRSNGDYLYCSAEAFLEGDVFRPQQDEDLIRDIRSVASEYGRMARATAGLAGRLQAQLNAAKRRASHD